MPVGACMHVYELVSYMLDSSLGSLDKKISKKYPIKDWHCFCGHIFSFPPCFASPLSERRNRKRQRMTERRRMGQRTFVSPASAVIQPLSILTHILGLQLLDGQSPSNVNVFSHVCCLEAEHCSPRIFHFHNKM